jgi:hypothetical protein
MTLFHEINDDEWQVFDEIKQEWINENEFDFEKYNKNNPSFIINFNISDIDENNIDNYFITKQDKINILNSMESFRFIKFLFI